MSEIVHMNQKLKQLVHSIGINLNPGEKVMFEMMITFAYTEGFTDGYAKGYTEALCENTYNEGGDDE